MNAVEARSQMSAMLERHLKKAEQIELEGAWRTASVMVKEDRYFTPEFHREYAAGHYRGWIEVLDAQEVRLRIMKERCDEALHLARQLREEIPTGEPEEQANPFETLKDLHNLLVWADWDADEAALKDSNANSKG